MGTPLKEGFHIVGISGKARSGKDTFANELVSEFGFVKINLADPLREFISNITGIPVKELVDGVRKEEIIPWLGVSPRKLMQTVGTEWGRDTIDPEIWLKVLYVKVQSLIQAGHPGVVIADVRFANEAEYIRNNLGGLVISVHRPGEQVAVEAHASENGIGSFIPDQTFINDGSIEMWRSWARFFGAGL